MKTISIFVILILIACSTINKKNMKYQQLVDLPSRIYVDNNVRQPSLIYYHGEKFEIDLSKGRVVHQGVLGWLNKNDLLLMLEFSKDPQGNFLYNRLVLIDIHKNIVDTIYSADISNEEYIFGSRISPNDSILLIQLNYRRTKQDSISTSYNPFDILVMDFKNKTIIDRLESFYSSRSDFRQCPAYSFSPDGKQFVYAISDERTIFKGSTEPRIFPGKKENGIYIYDFNSKEHQKIVDGGVDPGWSPDGSSIAYSDNNKVWFYNVDNKEKFIFYETKDDQTVVKTRWTPDGEWLYVLTRKKTRLHPRGILTHRLININDHAEIINGDLLKLGISFHWR